MITNLIMNMIKNITQLLIFFIILYNFIGPSLSSEEEKFKKWKELLREDAISMGISVSTFDKAINSSKIIKRIIELDQKQPETRITFNQYFQKVITKKRLLDGRINYTRYKKELEKVSKEYNVQSRFIIAIWGIETSYGNYTGKFPIISSLLTLAYEGRRAKLFREQLLDALKIIEEDDINLHEMQGSWAGAMGQSQFLPSSYLSFAQDFDKDGKKDIWTSHLDIFASIAYYLKSHGWDNTKTWGREVSISDENFKKIDFENTENKFLKYWNKMGFRNINGSNLPNVGIRATLLLPDGKNGKKFLVYDNFTKIKKYNASNFYALCVGLLSDGMKN